MGDAKVAEPAKAAAQRRPLSHAAGGGETPAMDPLGRHALRAPAKADRMLQAQDGSFDGPDPVLDYQGRVGNAALNRLLRGGVLRPKLGVSQPDDPHEREADRFAERSLSTHAPATTAPIVRPTRDADAGADADVKQVVAALGPGRTLDGSLRGMFEPHLGRDLGDVRVHTSHEAARTAHALNARAFTVGNDVAFAAGAWAPHTSAGQRLLAHELSHVAQQSGDSGPANAPCPRTIHRQADAGAGDAGAPAADPVTEIENALGRVPEGAAASVGDFPAAFRVLNGLAMFHMLRVLRTLHGHGNANLLWDHFNEATGVNTERLRTAFLAERLSRGDMRRVKIGDLVHFAAGLGSLPPEQVGDIESFMLGGEISDDEREGIEAFLDGTTDELPPGVGPHPAAAGNTPAGPGPGAPPGAAAAAGGAVYPRGKQHFWYWLGNIAHRLIAEYYETHHPADQVYANYIDLETLLLEAGKLRGMTPNTSAVPNLALRPDITNLTLWQLFEIKSMRRIKEAAARADMYVAAFRSAGIPISLGKSADRGANGFIPLAFAELRFASTMPGAIGYKFRMRRKQQGQEQEVGEGATQQPSAAAQAEMSPEVTAAIVLAAIGIIALCIIAPEVIPLLVGAGEATAGGEAAAGGVLLAEEALATEVELTAGALDGAGVLVEAAEAAEIEAQILETGAEASQLAAPPPLH
jgi:hypothetical protein